MLNLVGLVLTDLEVIKKHPIRDVTGRTQWLCKCKCTKVKLFTTTALRNGNPPKSCGKCEWHIKHKEAYVSWCSARNRCYSISDKDYKSYGGRGIRMCSRWSRFSNFFEDMGDPPKDSITGERLSLDRKNNNGNYELNNCRWATRSEQQLNKGKLENGENDLINQMN